MKRWIRRHPLTCMYIMGVVTVIMALQVWTLVVVR